MMSYSKSVWIFHVDSFTVRALTPDLMTALDCAG